MSSNKKDVSNVTSSKQARPFSQLPEREAAEAADFAIALDDKDKEKNMFKEHTDSGGALSNAEMKNFEHKYSNREVLSNSDTYSQLRDIINKPKDHQIERAGSANFYARADHTTDDPSKLQNASPQKQPSQKPLNRPK